LHQNEMWEYLEPDESLYPIKEIKKNKSGAVQVSNYIACTELHAY
jgi:hypothetical protein